MPRRILIISESLFVLLMILIAPGHAMAQQMPKPMPIGDRPIIEIDLHKFGYADPHPNGPYKNGSTLRTRIDFTNENSLILTWTTQDYGIGKAPKDVHFANLKGKLHSVLVDASTGREEAHQDWSVPIAWAALASVNDGKLLVCLENKIQLFAANFEKLAEMEVPAPSDCREVSYLRPSRFSPGNKSLILSVGIGENYKIVHLDPDTLRVISTSSELKPTIGSGGINPRSPPALKEVLHLDDDTLLTREVHRITVSKTDGAALLEAKLPDNRTFSDISIVDGRFAVMENRMRGIDSSFLDESKQPSNDEIVVYSISDGRAILALKVKGYSPWPPWFNHPNEFALSPDGDRLAVVSDGILRIYKLPANASAH
jgi:hypothetical protein